MENQKESQIIILDDIENKDFYTWEEFEKGIICERCREHFMDIGYVYLEIGAPDNCSCHLGGAPCSACVNNRNLECPVCGAKAELEEE